MSKLFKLKCKKDGVNYEHTIRVDDQDAYILRSQVWVLKRKITGFQVLRRINGVDVSLEQYLIDAPSHLTVQHKNGNTSDFCRENLRFGLAADSEVCINGHALTPENTYADGTKRGAYCKTCNQKAVLKYRIKKIAAELVAA